MIYYIGQTNSLSDRIKRHNQGYERFTRKYRPWTLFCSINKSARSDAVILERKLKNLSKSRLRVFITRYAGPDDHQP